MCVCVLYVSVCLSLSVLWCVLVCVYVCGGGRADVVYTCICMLEMKVSEIVVMVKMFLCLPIFLTLGAIYLGDLFDIDDDTSVHAVGK